jgi:hypothetical protein
MDVSTRFREDDVRREEEDGVRDRDVTVRWVRVRQTALVFQHSAITNVTELAVTE